MREPVQRRLAAIVAADVAGYSRLMGADEEGTLECLKTHRRMLIDPKIAEHRGRIVKTTGDGLLVEFPSAVDAVRCAAEVQRGMVDRNAETPEEKRIIFRVGVNLGDIIVDGDDIFGDGVERRGATGGVGRAGRHQIGRELGVRYMLEGSVRRAGDQIQVNAQLIDAASGAHVWADTFDTDRTSLAKAQDEIVGRLARTLHLEIVQAAARTIEQEKPVDPDARDFVMRGWAWYGQQATPAALQNAQQAFERALEIDPQSVEAKIGLATVLTEFVANGRSHVVNGVSFSREQDPRERSNSVPQRIARGKSPAVELLI